MKLLYEMLYESVGHWFKAKNKTINCVKRHMLMKCCYSLVSATEKVILVFVQYNDIFFPPKFY